MQVINAIQTWFSIILWTGLVVLHIWAIADCASRKAAAFPAVDRLTKPAWLAIVVVAGAVTILVQSPISILTVIAVTASSVYLADVRPAVREVSGGSRW